MLVLTRLLRDWGVCSMVEWKSIGSLLTRKRNKAKDLNEIVQVYSVTNNNGFVLSADMHDFTIHSEDTSNYLVVEHNDFAYNPSRLNIGSIAYFQNEGKGLISPMYVVFHANDNLIMPEYLYIVIRSEYVIKKIDALKEVGARFKFDFNRWDLIQIPIPSKEEQARIVSILDTFADSITNLDAQIKARRKQYEYYRDQLLDLEGKDGVEIKGFGEICKMIKGNGVQKVDFVENGFGCIHYGQIYTHYGSYTYSTNKFVSKEVFENAKKASKGDIIMADTSENVEDICKSVAYLGEEDIAVSNHALIIKHEQNPKFLSYSTLTRSFFLQKRKVVFGVKVSGIKPEHLAQIKIYLPSLQEQSRIVSILDQFEESIKNLEAQYELRKKQYEYYRNQLLSFE